MPDKMPDDVETENLVMTENYAAWISHEPDGEDVYHLELGAVTVHLFESLAGNTRNYGQQFGIGGAGPVAPATADRARARRPFRICCEDEAGGASGTGQR